MDRSPGVSALTKSLNASHWAVVLGGALALAASLSGCADEPPSETAPTQPSTTSFSTPHFLIESSADAETTQRAASALEALHAAYAQQLPWAVNRPMPSLQIRLYGSRSEFKASNRSHAWAEAYYLPPTSHAYAGRTGNNPYHWLMHEAVHQISRERSGFPRKRWLDEGLATYFGASVLADDVLQPGLPEWTAYPLWWMDEQKLSASASADIASGAFIPLRTLIEGDNVDFQKRFNQYYLQYWSLTHFLRHAEAGRYAEGHRRLLASAGTVADFEREIGPLSAIEPFWHAHHREWAEKSRGSPDRTP